METPRCRIALIGNPNCGKTTIFNLLTGAHQHVGNYSGVTVERVGGFCKLGEDFPVEIVDLPGVYSLSAGSPEEKVAFRELTGGSIDLILDVIDAGNAQRNLYLTTQLAELGLPMVLAFNMFDDAEARGLHLDLAKFSSFFGAPVIPTSASSGRGIDALKKQLRSTAENPAPQLPVLPKFGPRMEQAIRELGQTVQTECPESLRKLPPRCIALKLLEQDPEISALPEFQKLHDTVESWRGKISDRNGIGSSALLADARYGVIAGACREAITRDGEDRRVLSRKIDEIVLNRFFGIPIFLLAMYLVFSFAFTLGAYPTAWLDSAFSWFAEAVNRLWPAGEADILRRMITEGVIGGVGGVVVFMPNIVLLFAAISFLEGTGYMSRAAFVMDGFMHLFGLHGKSFIPLLLGFGCSVPAIMATRTIESERDRLTTILVLPFMSCGARLPIYALLIPAFFAPHYRSLIMWMLYLIGAIVALGGARLLKSALFRGDEEVFVMELPPYRMPTLQSILIQMWERTVMFLKKAGTVILFASLLLFMLNTFPIKKNLSFDYCVEQQRIEKADLSADEKQQALESLEGRKQNELLSYSIAGRIGHALEYVLKPAGFDWRVSSALVGALAGKEIFVAQLGVLYSISDAESGTWQLQQQLQKNYTPLQGFCIMLFCLLSIPCVATLAVVRRETNSWKWPLLQMAGFTLTAWTITFVVFQTGLLLQRCGLV